jgi:C-terminal processing protease CtpA/Prc
MRTASGWVRHACELIRSSLRSALAGVLLLTSSVGAHAGEDCARERIVAIAKLWSAVRWHHVNLAESHVDWDRSLAQALPALCSARNDHELSAAVERLMRPLHDPFYRLVSAGARRPVTPANELDELVEWLPADVALLHLHQGMSYSRAERALDARLERAIAALKTRATALVIDLRPVNAHDFMDANALESVLTHFIGTELRLPGERSLVRSDFRYDPDTFVGGLRSGVFVRESRVLRPAGATRPIPVAMLADGATRVPAVALALLKRGGAKVFSVGGSMPRAGLVEKVELSTGLGVEFSVGEYVFDDGTQLATVDGNVPDDRRSAADAPSVMTVAAHLASGAESGKATYKRVSATVPARRSDPHVEMAPPDLQWRRVAAIKYWSTADAVVPTDQRIPEAVAADALVQVFNAMAEADTPGRYIEALSRFTVALADTHAQLTGRMAYDHFGRGEVPIRLKRVEGRFLIVAKATGLSLRSGSLEVGDEVLQMDGLPMKVAIERRLPLVGGSTDAARERDVLRSLLRGPTGSSVELSVIGPSGGVRSVTLDRLASKPLQQDVATGPHYRRLADDVGYVDLVNLLPQQVDAMFDALGTCRALIVDVRGYPEGAVRAMARRLNRDATSRGPIFNQRVVSAFGPQQDNSEMVPVGSDATRRPYAGKIVVLTSIEGQSHTEHSVLVLEAAAPITVVGEPTTGTNGDIAVDVLPGGVNVTMTTVDVRHADGMRLQRVGIQPHVVVHQTVAGIRSGRDEQLEAAQRLLSETLRD